MLKCFVLCPDYSMCFLFVPVSLFIMRHLQMNLYRKKNNENISASIWSSCKACLQDVIFSLHWFLTFTCRTVLFSVQHIDMNIQHHCTNRVTWKVDRTSYWSVNVRIHIFRTNFRHKEVTQEKAAEGIYWQCC